MKADFFALTADEVISALGEPVPVYNEVERLMLDYSERIAAGADPFDVIIPGPATAPIEAVAMHLTHEALDMADPGGSPQE